jgi:hypothetical protein
MHDDSPNATDEYVIDVDIKRNPMDQGNSSDGRYDYAFKPDIALIKESDTSMVYRLTTTSDPALRVSGIYTTDARYQLGAPRIARDGRSVTLLNVNTQQMLIHVSLQVADIESGALAHFDPQVLNDPPL